MELSEIRKEIDEIDRQLVALFEKRMQVCQEVAEYKIETGKKVLDKERENQKLQMTKRMAHSEFNRHGVEEIFTQLMSISRKRQYQLLSQHGILEPLEFEPVETLERKGVHVVYQGVPGAYSHAALLQYFGEAADCEPVDTFADAMEAVQNHRADYAVLPIENSSAGQVADVYDLLLQYDNRIAAECYVRVEHALLGLPGARKEELQRVYSHPQGLMQCSGYLGQHRQWQQLSVANTAMAARKILEEQDPAQAAIASETAGRLYGLCVLEHGVNDNPNNTTRFIIVSSKKQYSVQARKVSICFEILHESGSLYNMLSHIIYNNLNMTKIESRPIPNRPFEYRFYVDFEGNLSEAAVINALSGIREEAGMLKILGNY